MTGSQQRQPTQEPQDDEERELMNPATWDWDAIEEGVTVGQPGTIFTLEFSRDEHRLLAEIASVEGLTTHQFIKRAALDAAHAKAPELASGAVSRPSRG